MVSQMSRIKKTRASPLSFREDYVKTLLVPSPLERVRVRSERVRPDLPNNQLQLRPYLDV